MKTTKKQKRQNKLAARLAAERDQLRDKKRRQVRLLIGGLAVIVTALMAIKYRTSAVLIGFIISLLGEALMAFDYYRYFGKDK